MEVFIGTLVVFLVVTLAMSIGVLVSGRSLKGSCGGTGGECPCTDAEKQSCARRARGGA